MKNRKEKIKKTSPLYVVLAIVLIAYSLSLIFMLLWGFNTSLKSNIDYSINGNYVALPNLNAGNQKFNLFQNYINVIKNFQYSKNITYENEFGVFRRVTTTIFGSFSDNYDPESIYFLDMFYNSIVYVFGCAFVATIMPALTAFLTAKYSYKLSSVIFVLYTMMMCMPIVGNQPAELAFFKATGLYDNMLGMVLKWASGGGMYFFVFYAYFKTMPETYREAADIDGASEFKIMVSIYFPLAIKMMATVFLIQFVSLWNDYQYPLLFLPTRPTLATVIYQLAGTSGEFINEAVIVFRQVPAKIAACMILAFPIFIVFILFKNKLMGDISLGGIKE